MTKLRSNSSIFERRGDPWTSDKEGLRDYGRNLLTENADMDWFTRATKAKEKAKFVDPPRPPKKSDYHVRKVNIAHDLNMRLKRMGVFDE